MAEQKPRAPRAPQQDGRDRPRCGQGSGEEEGDVADVAAASEGRGGDGAGRRRCSRLPALGAGRARRCHRALAAGRAGAAGRVSRRRTRPGGRNPRARPRRRRRRNRRRRACSPTRKGCALPRAEPERSTRRRYDDLQTRRLGGRVSSWMTKTRPLRLIEKEPEKGFEPLAPRLQGACSDQLSYSGSRHIVISNAACGFAAARSARHRMPMREGGGTLQMRHRTRRTP